MVHALIKLNLLKLTLLSAFGARVIATLIAIEVRKKNRRVRRIIKFVRLALWNTSESRLFRMVIE